VLSILRYSIECISFWITSRCGGKKINYITRKVADKLKSLFTENREDFEKKWNDIKIVLEYGMLSEDKFMKNQLLSFYILQLTTSFIHLKLKENKKKKLIKTEN
jgi:molecular chaperone HtpG